MKIQLTATPIRLLTLAAGGLWLASVASAQFVPPQAPKPPAETPPATETKPPAPSNQPAAPKPPASLDDLLGLSPEKPKDAPAPGAAPPAVIDPTRAELDRKLTPGEASDQFKQAVELMGQTAQRLQSTKDTGLATQRLQEDILRRLDMVIHSAEQQQQQSQSKSRQKQQDKDQQQQPQQDQQRQDASSNAARDAIQPPTRRDGPLNPDLAARGAAWGDLPDRVRESLSQGYADKYSDFYRKWTEAYYKKLAEEGSR